MRTNAKDRPFLNRPPLKLVVLRNVVSFSDVSAVNLI